jgi:hypothetical protein
MQTEHALSSQMVEVYMIYLMITNLEKKSREEEDYSVAFT